MSLYRSRCQSVLMKQYYGNHSDPNSLSRDPVGLAFASQHCRELYRVTFDGRKPDEIAMRFRCPIHPHIRFFASTGCTCHNMLLRRCMSSQHIQVLPTDEIDHLLDYHSMAGIRQPSQRCRLHGDDHHLRVWAMCSRKWPYGWYLGGLTLIDIWFSRRK